MPIALAGASDIGFFPLVFLTSSPTRYGLDAVFVTPVLPITRGTRRRTGRLRCSDGRYAAAWQNWQRRGFRRRGRHILRGSDGEEVVQLHVPLAVSASHRAGAQPPESGTAAAFGFGASAAVRAYIRTRAAVLPRRDAEVPRRRWPLFYWPQPEDPDHHRHGAAAVLPHRQPESGLTMVTPLFWHHHLRSPADFALSRSCWILQRLHVAAHHGGRGAAVRRPQPRLRRATTPRGVISAAAHLRQKPDQRLLRRDYTQLLCFPLR